MVNGVTRVTQAICLVGILGLMPALSVSQVAEDAASSNLVPYIVELESVQSEDWYVRRFTRLAISVNNNYVDIPIELLKEIEDPNVSLLLATKNISSIVDADGKILRVEKPTYQVQIYYGPACTDRNGMERQWSYFIVMDFDEKGTHKATNKMDEALSCVS